MNGTESQRMVVLDNVRSAHNVGSIFRTAEAAGVTHIYICGYTPMPIDRFGRIQPEIAKTALGAEVIVPWTHVEDVRVCIKKLQRESITVAAVEQVRGAQDYRSFLYPERIAFIFGNEVEGVAENVCATADTTIHIPMQGVKESLNVSVAAGIILFERGPSTR